MGIIRGGDSEYEEHDPSFEEKSAEWQKVLQPLLEEDPCLLKLSGNLDRFYPKFARGNT